MGIPQPNYRNVLIVTGGMTPQVVTETVYALSRRSPEPFVPAKIVCAVTGGSREPFGVPLESALSRLQAELGIAVDWQRRLQAWHMGETGLFIAVPSQGDGSAVDDIRSDDDAVRFGDLVSEIVRRETLDPHCRVHLSLAGGRKTMSFHGGAAMSLFARPQDELSHVLVHPPEFEQCREFWFPTKDKLTLKSRDGTELDAREARIELALIPYIRVRDRLTPALVAQAMDYASYVQQINAVLGVAPLSLELVTSACRVHVGEIGDFTLPNTEFALYQLMAEWKRNDYAGASSRGIGPDHRGWMTARMFGYPEEYEPNPVVRFLEIYDQTFRTSGERSDSMGYLIHPRPAEAALREQNRAAFAQWKARLSNALQDRLHHSDLADRFGAPLSPVRVRARIGTKTGNRVVFGLRLDPREITIRLA